MSKQKHHQERRIRVRGVRRETIDVRKLGKAVIALAAAAAEAEAEAEHQRRADPESKEQP